MPEAFPAVGHRYMVDFKAFIVELHFESETSLTYTGNQPDKAHGGFESVDITVEPLRDQLFLVSWQEDDDTTVVHLEDYKNNTIVAHVTASTGKFLTFRGTMKKLA